MPLTRPALGGGALLVSLYLLGEYGAFAALRYQTFATAIFTEYQVAYDTASASVLTLMLCALALVVVVGETRCRADGARRRRARYRRAPRRATALGWARLGLRRLAARRCSVSPSACRSARPVLLVLARATRARCRRPRS